MKAIDEHSTVVMHFNLYAESGHIAKSTYEEKPVKFTMGDDSFSAFFEKSLYGLSKGAKKMVILEPENAFGDSNPRNIQTLPRERFSADLTLQPNTVVEFNQGGQGRLYGIVKSLTEQTVTVDFNHPLAGQTLKFDVEIVEVL